VLLSAGLFALDVPELPTPAAAPLPVVVLPPALVAGPAAGGELAA